MDRLLDELKADEGWVPHAYPDHLGFWTIGYGFLIDERRNGRLPGPVAEFWLRWEIDRIQDELARRLPWFAAAPEPARRALTNMAYQLGTNGLLNFRRTLAHCADGGWEAAADEALRSRWAEQTPNRAKRVTDLIRSASA